MENACSSMVRSGRPKWWLSLLSSPKSVYLRGTISSGIDEDAGNDEAITRAFGEGFCETEFFALGSSGLVRQVERRDYADVHQLPRVKQSDREE
ncbi:hypothetical protein L6452_01926 [Arctium lappa]|uniref:Uncharacterized protein n=1 Tax=Arctium lappa TaxID=4217 RepID=A0ACB9FI77_ARCLA|nr:hypothetical protein L6452_01926 [Arctium lappa]